MRRLAALAFALIGINALLRALVLVADLTWLVQGLLSSESRAAALASAGIALAVALGLVVIGARLIVRREALAERLFDEAPLDLVLDARDVLRVGLVVTGFYFLLETLPSVGIAIGSFFTQSLQARAMGLEPDMLLQQRLDSAVALAINIVVLILSAVLIAGSKRLSRMIWDDRSKPEVLTTDDSSCPSCGAPFKASDYADREHARCANCHEMLYTDGGT